MTLNLLKMAVGIEDVDHLAEVQRDRRKKAADGRARHFTRNVPKRAAELLDGGSMYWIIRGQIRVRQRLLAIETGVDVHGKPGCALVLAAKLVRTVPRPARAMQGWRYLNGDAAPLDLAAVKGAGDLPPELVEELRQLGLI
jgi:hypothetical protein